ncbi:MAG TPA: CheR family methyltransferase [Abditibacteriaceae bacterium]|jgi:chemotaxis protein methyltransferase CheR
MEPQLFQQCQQLIAERMGLQMRPQDAALFLKTLATRIQTLRLSSGEEYYALLQNGSARGEAEWKQLYILLTNQESYFFRDLGQFQLLRERVLPELIEKNRDSRSLRVWSAGCSTGEEPYSLAILIDQLLPLRADWNVTVIGTDLSEFALDKARRGVYGSWSFRTLDRQIQERYFHPRQQHFEIEPRIHQSVTFRHNNLLQDPFPDKSCGLFDMDLIVCRNVFIYFKRDAVAAVIRKFGQTLREGGYLLAGHAELHDTPLGNLKVRSFPQTVIYQRVPESRRTNDTSEPQNQFGRAGVVKSARETERSRIAPVVRPASAPPSRPQRAVESKAPLHRAAEKILAPATPEMPVAERARLALLKSGPDAALSILEALLVVEPPSFAVLCVAAQAHANAGRYDLARSLCVRATKINGFASTPHFVMARIAEEEGDTDTAKELLRKVIYLSPNFVAPYLELSAIYGAEGDETRAGKMRETARDLLTGHSLDDAAPADPLLAEPPLPVRELKKHLD